MLVGADVNDPHDPNVIDIATPEITDRVLDHLTDAGASRLALINGVDPIQWNRATEQRYRERMREAGREEIVLYALETEGRDAGVQAADELLALPERPDGIYCLTSEHARGLVEQLVARGVRIPEDIRIVCGSDADSLRTATPSVTSVDLQPEALGRQAAAAVLRQLEPDLDISVPEPDHGRIIRRESTASGRWGRAPD
jgi:DNA-binding LacI/PurR family transcriptional regulator